MTFVTAIGLRAPTLRVLLALAYALILTACGGGGAPELLCGQVLPNSLYSTAPATLTLAPGAAQTFSVGGGKPCYSTSSSNQNVAKATVSGGTLVISGLGAGSAEITVFDAAGSSTSTTVTVASAAPVVAAPPFFASAPSAVTLAIGEVASYTIGGGAPPYLQSSSNAGVATASVSGANLTITGRAAGTAEVSVLDSTGATLKVSVGVGSTTSTALYMTAPSTITGAPGMASSFTIGGGKPPYTVSSSNAGVAAASISGSSTLAISANAAGTAQIVVFDSTGASVSTTLTVVAPAAPASTALFVAAPSALTIAVDVAQSYAISGGTAPYTVSSSNTSVASASGAGTSLTISGKAAGTAQVVVFDAAGQSVTVNVTVGSGTSSTALFTTAPNAITLASGEPVSIYTISGGTAPYSASSSNTSVASASASATSLTISGKAAGSAQVVVFDAAGQSVTVTVTVVSGASSAPLFTTAPDAITLASGAPVSSYTISGGAAPYSASSSNASVVNAVVEGTSLRLTSVAAGTARVVISDAVGATVEIAVTVTSTTTTPTPLVVMPSVSTASVGDILSFSISGGSGAYGSVTVNNASIAAVGASGDGPFSTVFNPAGATTFFAKLLNVGTTTVAIVDSLGQTSTLTLAVNTRSSSLGLSPSALQIGEDSRAPISLSIYGGTAPYTALTDDLQLSSVSIAGTSALPTLTIGLGFNGSRCITPYDSPSPPQLYVTNGIYNVTVTVIDSLGASATSTLSIKDNGNGEFDPLCTARFSVSPVGATDVAGSVLTFTLTGGLPNYTVTSNDPAIATVSPLLVTSGGTFSATLISTGTTTVTIKDSRGITTTVFLTVI